MFRSCGPIAARRLSSGETKFAHMVGPGSLDQPFESEHGQLGLALGRNENDWTVRCTLAWSRHSCSDGLRGWYQLPRRPLRISARGAPDYAALMAAPDRSDADRVA